MSADSGSPDNIPVLAKVLQSVAIILSTIVTLIKLRSSEDFSWSGFWRPGVFHKSLVITLLVLLAVFQTTSFLKPVWVDPIVAMSITSVVAVAFITIALLIVWKENDNLKRSFASLHYISHQLRDMTHAVIRDGIKTTTADEMNQERLILNSICGKASLLFTDLIGEKCHVCITLVDPDSPDDDKKCFLWARSPEETHQRNNNFMFSIEKNTRFKYLLDKSGQNGTLAFYSADLQKLGDEYLDEIPNWKSFYRSMIVVPIRCNSKGTRIDIGYLKLETYAINRLNGSSHVELMASIADQIFSFLDTSRLRKCGSQPNTVGELEHNFGAAPKKP